MLHTTSVLIHKNFVGGRVVNGPVQTEWTAVWTVDRVGLVSGIKDRVDRLDR